MSPRRHRGYQGFRLNFRVWWFRVELLPRLRVVFDPRKVL